jgi:hypothetical protein
LIPARYRIPGVSTAVELDDQAVFETGEINNEIIYRHLPPEMKSLWPERPQPKPESRFLRCRSLAQRTRDPHRNLRVGAQTPPGRFAATLP